MASRPDEPTAAEDVQSFRGGTTRPHERWVKHLEGLHPTTDQRIECPTILFDLDQLRHDGSLVRLDANLGKEVFEKRSEFVVLDEEPIVSVDRFDRVVGT